MLHFKAHQPTPPSFSPLASESSFVCNVPHFQTHWPPPPSFSPLASESLFAACHFSQAHQCASPFSCPPVSEPSVTCHVSKLTNGLLPLPPPCWCILVCNVPHF